MSNLFGIALDQVWLRWAAAEGVTETVIAAVSLLHERTVEEVAAKLSPIELADVARLVSRCPSHYPLGAFDALKALRNVALLPNWALIPNEPEIASRSSRPIRRPDSVPSAQVRRLRGRATDSSRSFIRSRGEAKMLWSTTI
jgi:hypothetical protein